MDDWSDDADDAWSNLPMALAAIEQGLRASMQQDLREMLQSTMTTMKQQSCATMMTCLHVMQLRLEKNMTKQFALLTTQLTTQLMTTAELLAQRQQKQQTTQEMTLLQAAWDGAASEEPEIRRSTPERADALPAGELETRRAKQQLEAEAARGEQETEALPSAPSSVASPADGPEALAVPPPEPPGLSKPQELPEPSAPAAAPPGRLQTNPPAGSALLAQFDYEVALFGGQGRPDCVEAAQILSARLEHELEAANAQAAQVPANEGVMASATRAAEAETGIEEIAARALQRELEPEQQDSSSSWSWAPRLAAFEAADGAAAELAATDGSQSEASTEGYQMLRARPAQSPPTRSPDDCGRFPTLPASACQSPVSPPAPASNSGDLPNEHGGFGSIAQLANFAYVREGHHYYLVPRVGPRDGPRVRVQWWLKLSPDGYHTCLLCKSPFTNEHFGGRGHKKKQGWLENLSWAQQKRMYDFVPDACDQTILEWW
jgi:hypothetical protein